MDAEDAAVRLYRLHSDLYDAIAKDPALDVRDLAVAQLRDVLDAVLDGFRPNEPAVRRLRDLTSPGTVAVRAMDLYLVVGQLLAALPLPAKGIDLLN